MNALQIPVQVDMSDENQGMPHENTYTQNYEWISLLHINACDAATFTEGIFQITLTSVKWNTTNYIHSREKGERLRIIIKIEDR